MSIFVVIFVTVILILEAVRKIIVWLLKSSELNYDFLRQIAPWFVILTSLLASGLKYFQYEQEFTILMTVWCISIYFLGRGKFYSINRSPGMIGPGLAKSFYSVMENTCHFDLKLTDDLLKEKISKYKLSEKLDENTNFHYDKILVPFPKICPDTNILDTGEAFAPNGRVTQKIESSGVERIVEKFEGQITFEYEICGQKRDLTLCTVYLEMKSREREYFLLFDNRPLVQIKKYIEYCHQHISDKSSLEYQNAFKSQAEWELNRYKEELKKLIERKECCFRRFLLLDYEGQLSDKLLNYRDEKSRLFHPDS